MSPYDILQVSRDATDEEVKKAYRKLSKKYHPDANIGNPHQEEYTEMFKQVQSAYDTIMAERRGEFTGFGSASSGFSQESSAYTYANDAMAYRDIAAYIQAGRYQEASSVLEGIRARSDVWFYYSALCEHGMGNAVRAREYAQVAVQMNPMNFQYQILLQQLSQGQTAYSTASRSYGRSVSTGNCCYTYLFLQCIAGMLFGRGLPCLPFFFCC